MAAAIGNVIVAPNVIATQDNGAAGTRRDTRARRAEGAEGNGTVTQGNGSAAAQQAEPNAISPEQRRILDHMRRQMNPQDRRIDPNGSNLHEKKHLGVQLNSLPRIYNI